MSGLRGVEGFQVEIFLAHAPSLVERERERRTRRRRPRPPRLSASASRRTRALSKKGAETRCQSAKPAGV